MKIKEFLKGGGLCVGILGGCLGAVLGIVWLAENLGAWGVIGGLLLVTFILGGVTAVVLS